MPSPPPSALPARDPAAEDQFVAAWRDADLAEDDLLEAVVAALSAGRPQLGARLVGLLPPQPDEPPAISRARRAARLLLHEGGPAAAQALHDELEPLRSLHFLRGRARQRASLLGQPTPRRRR